MHSAHNLDIITSTTKNLVWKLLFYKMHQLCNILAPVSYWKHQNGEKKNAKINGFLKKTNQNTLPLLWVYICFYLRMPVVPPFLHMTQGYVLPHVLPHPFEPPGKRKECLLKPSFFNRRVSLYIFQGEITSDKLWFQGIAFLSHSLDFSHFVFLRLCASQGSWQTHHQLGSESVATVGWTWL